MACHLHPREETVSVEAALAVLAHLDAAAGAATYLDYGLGNPETWPFRLIEECREAVADQLGVKIDRYLKQPNETLDEYDARLDAWTERDRRIEAEIQRVEDEREDGGGER